MQAFVRRKQLERDGDQFDDLVEAARSCRPQKRFQLRKRHLNRIEVGAVRREKSESGPDLFNRGLDCRLFVRREVVENDHIAGAQCRDKDLLDIREECGVIDGPIEDRRRRETVRPQAGHHRVCLPVPARRVIPEACAARTAAIATQEVGRDARFINEDVGARVVQRLRGVPLAPGGRDVRPALFVGVYGFF